MKSVNIYLHYSVFLHYFSSLLHTVPFMDIQASAVLGPSLTVSAPPYSHVTYEVSLTGEGK